MTTNSERAQPRDRFEVTFPFEPGAARSARMMVSRLLLDHDCADLVIDDSRHVVHELVVNAVLHGEPDEKGELLVSCAVSAEDVAIVVHDRGQRGVVEVQPPTEDGDGGRGLAMVEAMSRSWAVDRSDGTRVTAVLPR